jgi:hypothetical protein
VAEGGNSSAQGQRDKRTCVLRSVPLARVGGTAHPSRASGTTGRAGPDPCRARQRRGASCVPVRPGGDDRRPVHPLTESPTRSGHGGPIDRSILDSSRSLSSGRSGWGHDVTGSSNLEAWHGNQEANRRSQEECQEGGEGCPGKSHWRLCRSARRRHSASKAQPLPNANGPVPASGSARVDRRASPGGGVTPETAVTSVSWTGGWRGAW